MFTRLRPGLLLFSLCSLTCSLYADSRLVFPRLVYQQGHFSGIAIANPTSTDATITMTAYNADGSLFTGSGITNPRTDTIRAGAQYAVLATQIFTPPASIIDSPTPVDVWMEVTSPVDGLTGFFLDGNNSLDFLDGSDLSGAGADLVLPFVENISGTTTEITIVNPDSAGSANVNVELVDGEGTLVRTHTISIPARGAVQGGVAVLFPGSFDSVRVIRLHGDRPIASVAFVMRQPENSLVAVGARNAGSPVKVLYFPQLAQGADWSTVIGIVNLTFSQELVTLTAYQTDGTLFSAPALQNNPVSLTLKPGGSIRMDAKTLFGFADTPLQLGWIKAEAGDAALTGYVEYGAGTNRALVAAQTTTLTRAIFSHQANTSPYYTGLAVLNPSSLAANVEVMSMSSAGVALGKTKRILKPRQREAVLIDQWIGGAAGAVGGSIFLKSDVPVIATQLFGTNSFTALSNVPPQEVPEAFDPIGAGSLQVTPSRWVMETGKTKTFTATGATVSTWKVNGVAPGSSGSGTVTTGGLYTAPAVAPAQHTQSVEAATDSGDQSSAASVDVVQREQLTGSLTLLTAVAYFQNLQRFFIAEQQLLSSAPGDGRTYATVANTRISEVATTGTASSFFPLANDTVSKMVPFTDGGGNSHLLLAGLDSGTIYRLTLSNKAISTVSTGLVHPNSMALDPVSGDLYVSEGDPANRVTVIERNKFDASSAAPSALSESGPGVWPLNLSTSPRGIAFDPCTGAMYVSTADGILHQFLDKLDTQVITGLVNPGQVLVLHRQGLPSCVEGVTVFVAENGSTPRVAQIDPRTGAIISFLDATQYVADLGFFDADSPFSGSGEEAIIIGEGPAGVGLSRILVVRVGRLYKSVPDDAPLSSGLEFYPAGVLDGSVSGGGATRITYYDRIGDTFATVLSRQAGVVIPDISSISIYQVAGQNVISVTLTKPVVAASVRASNSLYGFIDLDVTGGTGSPSHADPFRTYRAGDPETDAYIDLSTGTLYNTVAGPAGGAAALTSVPVTMSFFRNTFSASFPLSILDALKSRVNVTVGNRVETTDIAPEYRFAFLKLPPLSGRTVQFSRTSASGSEATSPVSIGVFLSSLSTQTVTVQYAVTGGTATGGGVDYTLQSGTLTFAPGETTKQISLAITNDTTPEPSETVIVSLSNAAGANLGTGSVFTYTILDDDTSATPTVHFSAAASSGLESVTSVNLAVTLSSAATQTVTVQYAATGGTATGGGVDYTLAAGTLTFAQGETSKNIQMTVVNDTTDEPDETVIVTLSSPQGALLGSPFTHTYTILDDDNPTPRVQFSLASSSGLESTTSVSLVVTLSTAATQSVTVQYAVTGGTATRSLAGGGDYSLSDGTLSFAPGETSKNISMTVINDTLDEPDETVIVSLSSPVNAILGTNSTHTYTILDDDPAPLAQFQAGSSSGSEATTPVTISVTLTPASGKTVTVQYAVTGGTATGNGVDYTLSPGTITFAPGVTSANISLTVINDTQPEPDETVVVSLSNPVNATIGQIPSFTYTIVDNDPPPDLAIPGGFSVRQSSVPAGQPNGLVLSSWTVVNQGKGASGAFSNGFYLSTDSVIASSDTYLTGNSNSGLAAGGSFQWGGPSLTIPAGTKPGNYWIGILVDYNNAVYESNEANNYASVAITVLPGADLGITTTTLSASPLRIPLVGGTVTLSSWTVQNLGYVSSGSFQISYYLSTDTSFDAKDILLGTGSSAGLAPGASASYSPSFSIPAGTPKTNYYVIVVVDSQNSVQEYNESNNMLTSSNTVSIY